MFLIVGSEFLVYTTNMEDLIIKVLSLQFVVLVDRIFFDSFLAHNKKQDIRRTVISQVQETWHRVSISWIGEMFKFCLVIVLAFLLSLKFRGIMSLHKLCWACSRHCENDCSLAFDYCQDREYIIPPNSHVGRI